MPQNKVQYREGLSLSDFIQAYGTEEKCLAALELARWPEGFHCPQCAPSARKRTRSALYALAAETHCQASIPLTKWSLWHQAMADDNFGGMTPKGNVAWVPTVSRHRILSQRRHQK